MFYKREQVRKYKMRRQIHFTISMGITIIILISILIIGCITAKRTVGSIPDITSSTPVSSINTYYFD